MPHYLASSDPRDRLLALQAAVTNDAIARLSAELAPVLLDPLKYLKKIAVDIVAELGRANPGAPPRALTIPVALEIDDSTSPPRRRLQQLLNHLDLELAPIHAGNAAELRQLFREIHGAPSTAPQETSK